MCERFGLMRTTAFAAGVLTVLAAARFFGVAQADSGRSVCVLTAQQDGGRLSSRREGRLHPAERGQAHGCSSSPRRAGVVRSEILVDDL